MCMDTKKSQELGKQRMIKTNSLKRVYKGQRTEKKHTTGEMSSLAMQKLNIEGQHAVRMNLLPDIFLNNHNPH